MLSRPHPAAFARALASDPKQSERSKHHRAFQDANTAALLIEDDAKRLRRMLRDHGVPDADAAAYVAPLSTHAAIDAALNWYRASFRGTSGLAIADTPAVRVPTVFLWGDADQTVGRLPPRRRATSSGGPTLWWCPRGPLHYGPGRRGGDEGYSPACRHAGRECPRANDVVFLVRVGGT
jgi:hypothetical protein